MSAGPPDDPAEALVHCGPTEYKIDPRFRSHFRRLRQVFLYVNDQCNLSCKQCIYKPHVTYHEDREIALPSALGLLTRIRE